MIHAGRFALAVTSVVLYPTGIIDAAPPVVPRIESTWATTTPVIDGDRAEWADHLTPIAGPSISVGVQNDAEFFYLVVTTGDASTRELLARSGFTLWWDPTGKGRKNTGIAVPPIVTLVPPDTSEDGKVRRSGGPVRDIDPVAHLEMIGPRADDRRRLELTYLRTVAVDAAGAALTTVVSYELKIPLAAGDRIPYAIAVATDGSGSIGIETKRVPKYKAPDNKRGGRGLSGLGGFGRGGAGGRGGPGGGPGSPGPAGRSGPDADDDGEFAARPFEQWVQIKLAPKTT